MVSSAHHLLDYSHETIFCLTCLLGRANVTNATIQFQLNTDWRGKVNRLRV